MNKSYQFYQLDVFTNEAFAGNPLAVFPNGEGVSDGQMQQIAREMNLSETVFVMPSDNPEALRRLRIFTPTKELPMAGHPVVGTWNLLARLGFIEIVPASGKVQIKHELGIGVLPVEIEFADGAPAKVTMTQGKFTPGEIVFDKQTLLLIAESFGFTVADFAANAPVQICGTGIDFTLVPVRSLTTLKNVRANPAKLEQLPKSLPGQFSLFTRETMDGGDSQVHTRMFAPEFGIVEDPATGSAAGAIGGYLLHHGLLADKQDNAHRFTIEQGDFIERPSRIAVEVIGTKGNVEKVRIGGQSVVVAKGEMFI